MINDPEELEEVRQQYESLRAKLLLPEVRARLIADGREPDAEIKTLDECFAQADAAAKRAYEADEKVLQSQADVADSMVEIYRGLKQRIAEVEAAQPFHPGLEEAREFLEALAERVPKDEL